MNAINIAPAALAVGKGTQGALRTTEIDNHHRREICPAARRVPSVPGESVGRYKLPDSGSLPHTMVIRSAGGSHYLVTIVAVQEMGIEVLYRRLLPEEIPGYLETP